MGDFNIRRHRYSCMVLSTITDKTTIKSADLVLIFSQDVQNTSVQKCEFYRCKETLEMIKVKVTGKFPNCGIIMLLTLKLQIVIDGMKFSTHSYIIYLNRNRNLKTSIARLRKRHSKAKIRAPASRAAQEIGRMLCESESIKISINIATLVYLKRNNLHAK